MITFSTAFNLPADNYTNKKNLQTKAHKDSSRKQIKHNKISGTELIIS